MHRKFDIRQWVLVTSSSPMTAWFYGECYLRFCAEDYSLTDLTNVFSHLSNNCIARKSLHFQSGPILMYLPAHTPLHISVAVVTAPVPAAAIAMAEAAIKKPFYADA